jgi:hypothetical protein
MRHKRPQWPIMRANAETGSKRAGPPFTGNVIHWGLAGARGIATFVVSG